MRQLSDDTRDRLAAEAPGLCHCWRITRTDGVEIGLTDHDEDVTFGGTTFRADAAVTTTALRQTAGLDPDDAEIEGALASDALSDADLRVGRFDGARVELWRVDWEGPEARLLLRVGRLGEVTFEDGAYRGAFLSLKQRLGTVAGRVFSHACDASLGDARCGVSLMGAPFVHEVALTAATERTLSFAAPEGVAPDWFANGTAEVLDGPLAGLVRPVRDHAPAGTISLWRALPEAPAPGTRLRLTAGCDKRLATCRDRFANVLNFRGQPHMPGADVLTATPAPGERP